MSTVLSMVAGVVALAVVLWLLMFVLNVVTALSLILVIAVGALWELLVAGVKALFRKRSHAS